MSLPDVVSGLLLSEGSDVRIVSGVPDVSLSERIVFVNGVIGMIVHR